jgi:mono/diheme cytochrome c family protein
MIHKLSLLVVAFTICGCSDNANDVSDLATISDAGVDASVAASPDGGCTPVPVGPVDPDLVSAGKALVLANNCQQCHGDNLSGNFDGVMFTGHTMPAYPPNLTPDPATGLGCWTDQQIVNALLNGVDDQNQPLCPPMPHFSSFGMDPADAIAIATFLRTLKPSVNQVPATPACQPWGHEGGGCNATSDCPKGDVCSYQFCIAPPAQDGGEDAMPTDGGVDLRPPVEDMSMRPSHDASVHPTPDAGAKCSTSAVSVGFSPNPAITFGTVQLSAKVSTSHGCVPSQESYKWSFVSVPPSSHAAFNLATVSDPSFVPDVANGAWQVHLTYSNLDSGQTFNTEVQVKSNGCFSSPPAAQINTLLPSVSIPFADGSIFGAATDASAFGPPDLTFAVGTGVQLSGASSTDPSSVAACGSVPALQYSWTIAVEPPGSAAHLSAASGPTSNLTLDVAGRYVLGLVVTNGTLTSAPSYIRIDAM